MKAAVQVTCPKCKRRIVKIHFKRHKGSDSCLGSQKILEVMEPVEALMAERGWVRLGHAGWRKTLDKAGVPWERDVTSAKWDDGFLVVSKGSWVPKWAHDVVTNRSLAKKRIAVLKLCMANEEKRDAIHSVMLMTEPRRREAAIIQLYRDWNMKRGKS